MAKTSELIKLARDTFNVEPGISLLRELEESISTEMYDESANRVYYRIGQMDLVRRLKMLASISDEQFLDLQKSETTDDNLNEGDL